MFSGVRYDKAPHIRGAYYDLKGNDFKKGGQKKLNLNYLDLTNKTWKVGQFDFPKLHCKNHTNFAIVKRKRN